MTKKLGKFVEEANLGYIGINEKLEISSGYDDRECRWCIGFDECEDGDDCGDGFDYVGNPIEPITAQAKVALATLMLCRWLNYLTQALKEGEDKA